MKSETKAVIASIVVLALALTAVSGVTYSWFSDTEKADIDVSTAVVKYESTFASSSGIGGDATSGFVLKNIAANLNESITVSMTNHSTIDTVYRVYVSYSLATGATIGDYDLQNILINGKPLSSVDKDTGKIVVKNWTSVVKPDAESASVGSVTIPIATPSTYGEGEDMSTARSGLTIKVVVEVYQGDYDMPTSAPISGGTATIPEMDIGTTGEKASVTVTNLPTDAGSNLNASVAKDSADMYVISASVDGKSDFGDHSVTVTLVIPGNHVGSNVVYLGTTGEQPADLSWTYNGTNNTTTIVFTTTHFSEFAVAKDVVAIADTADGVGVFDSLNEAFKEVVSGGYVVLVSDAEIDATVVVDNVATLNLNDKKIFNSVDLWNTDTKSWSLISVRGGDLTILGSGKLQAKENDCYAVDLQNDGKCVIKDGIFIGNVHSVYVKEGDLTVEGGMFSVQQTYSGAGKEYEFVLNCLDANYKNGTATITVSGGSFEKFNPMNCWAEGENTNYLAEGYVAFNKGDIYTVCDITKVEGNVFDGENAYTTMEKALDGIHETGKNVLWCKPGADLGELSHGHICKDLTIYGNGASLSKGDFAIDYGPNKYGVTHYLTSDITLTIFSLNHVSVWGSRNTDYTVNINIYDSNVKEVLFKPSENGVMNVTISGCNFDIDKNNDGENPPYCDSAVYLNSSGKISITGTSFKGYAIPINLNNKSGGVQDVYLEMCTFVNCGNETADDNNGNNSTGYAAPVRIVASVENSVSKLTVVDCSFEYTDGSLPLVGDYRFGDTRDTENPDLGTIQFTGSVDGKSYDKETMTPGTALGHTHSES